MCATALIPTIAKPTRGVNLLLLVVRPTAVRRKPVKEFGAGFRIDLLSYSLITDAMVEDAGAFYQVVCQGNQSQGIFGSDADREYYLEGTGGVPAALRLRFMLSADEQSTSTC